jgi:hypothetical protein
MVPRRLSRRAANVLGEDRIVEPGAVEYAGLFLLSGDIAVENLDDAIDVGNQFFCLQRIPCWGRAPKMTLVFPSSNGLAQVKRSWGVTSSIGKKLASRCRRVAALFLALQGLPKPAVMPRCFFAA